MTLCWVNRDLSYVILCDECSEPVNRPEDGATGEQATTISMSTNELFKGIDPECPAVNELSGRVEDEVKTSGLRGKAAYAAEREQLKPLLAEHRTTCEVCREYQREPDLADYVWGRRTWPIFAGAAIGYLFRVGGSPKIGGALGLGLGVVITLGLMRRRLWRKE